MVLAAVAVRVSFCRPRPAAAPRRLRDLRGSLAAMLWVFGPRRMSPMRAAGAAVVELQG
jgi:hypothetical protein